MMMFFVLLVLVATYYSLSVVDMAMIAEIGLLDPFLDVVFQEKNGKMIFFTFDCAWLLCLRQVHLLCMENGTFLPMCILLLCSVHLL